MAKDPTYNKIMKLEALIAMQKEILHAQSRWVGFLESTNKRQMEWLEELIQTVSTIEHRLEDKTSRET